jgi:LPS sulfotransferase NodH
MTDTPQSPHYDLLGAESDFANWEGPPLRSWLVCTNYRSGSNLLAEALLELGSFGCPQEYFDKGVRPLFAQRWQAHDLNALLRALYRHRTDPSGSLGVKLDWGHAIALCIEHDTSQQDLLRANVETLTQADAARVYGCVWERLHAFFPQPRFLHLTRRDKVRQAVSWVRACQTRRYWGLPTALREPELPAEYDYDRILKAVMMFVYSEKRLQELFAWAGVEPVRVVYEEFIADYSGTVCRVAAQWDGRQNVTVPLPRLQRQSNGQSEQWVRRFLEEHSSLS